MDKPILSPLSKLFASRKFILALAYIAANLLVRAIPDLRPWVYDLTMVFTIALGLPFLHISVEDIVKLVIGYNPTSIEQAEHDAAQDAIDTALGNTISGASA